MATELDKPEKRDPEPRHAAAGPGQGAGPRRQRRAPRVGGEGGARPRRPHCQAAGELTSNFAKELLGATRKYVIPLLEHFDKIGLTVRNDSVRKLKPGWEKVLP